MDPSTILWQTRAEARPPAAITHGRESHWHGPVPDLLNAARSVTLLTRAGSEVLLGRPRRTGHQLWQGEVLKAATAAPHIVLGQKLEFEERHVLACTVPANAREIQRAIAAILLNEWDPIGVNDVPEAADEYDSYVGEVYRLIAAGADAGTIATRLGHIETNRMGLGQSPTSARIEVAQHLLQLDVGLSGGAV